MQAATQVVAGLPGGWSAFEHIYPFYSHLDKRKEIKLQDLANAYLDDVLPPRLEYAGNLYMQMMVSPLEVINRSDRPPLLKRPEKRRRAGEFYTCAELVDYCVQQTQFAAGDKTFLDPACGTGNFLLGALYQSTNRLSALNRIYGWDIDGKAISIARVLLLIACADELNAKLRTLGQTRFAEYLSRQLEQLNDHLQTTDATGTLSSAAFARFDIVAGNPPYISFGSRNQPAMAESQDRFLRKKFPAAAQYKIRMHSIFQELALRLAEPGGEVVLLLPDAFLTGAFYERLRKFIDTECRIISLSELPESTFPDATAGQWCIAHYRKLPGAKAPQVVTLRKVHQDRSITTFELPYCDLRSQDKCRFRLIFDQRDLSIIRKLDKLPLVSSLYKGHTGIRARHGQASIIATTRQKKSFKPGIVSGGQIQHHKIKWQGHYLNVDPEILFGGGFDASIIDNPKVLLRQTADRLIAAVDTQGLYHLNNVHSFAPIDKPEIDSCAFLAALMNSRLWLYLYQSKSRERKRALAQIDIEMVESMPLPGTNQRLDDAIKLGMGLWTRQNTDKGAVSRAIDRIVYELYELTDEEILHIEHVTNEQYADPLPSSKQAIHLLQSLGKAAWRG
jgi:SAM-dependent methyltransferase